MLLVIVKANLYGDNSFTTNGNFLVSNYGVKYNLLLTVNNIEILFKFKRGTAMPRSKSEVVGKPLFRDMVIAAHAIRVRTITPFSLNSLEFPTFPTSR